MTLWQTLFGFAGRIGRSTFWLLVIAVLLLDLAVVALISDWIHSRYLEAGIPHRPGGDVIGAGFILLVVGMVSAWATAGLMVKRAHDLERSGWWLLIGLIPVYGLARMIMDLGFLTGSSRRNRFGDGARFPRNRQAGELDRPAVLSFEAAEPLQADLVDPDPVQDLSDQAVPTDETLPISASESDFPNPESEPKPEYPATRDPEVASLPDLVHPLMVWGKSYRADLNWPEFQAFTSADQGEDPSSADAETPPAVIAAPTAQQTPWPQDSAPDLAAAHSETSALTPETSKGPDTATERQSDHPLEPALSSALAWAPAPAHEFYGELEALTPEPANDAPAARLTL